MSDAFHDVCEERGRHIAVAGHDPDCPNAEEEKDVAPIVYDEDGTPLRVRLVGAECLGEVSGEGHYGYKIRSDEDPTVFFEEAADE